LTLSCVVCYQQTGNLEDTILSCRSKAIERHLQQLDRYRYLSPLSSSSASSSFLPDIPLTSSDSSLPQQVPDSCPLGGNLHKEPLLPKIFSPLSASMAALIKINSFSGERPEVCEDVEEYLDDVETAALSWNLTITPGIVEASNKSKIRLFRQNLERDGDAWHWWYYVLPDADKKDFCRIAAELCDRYGVKAAQAPSLFAMQDRMLSLIQGEKEHIREYVHRVEKLSRKIPKDMDFLFAIAFIKGMRDQERRQRVTFDLKDTPNFSFSKGLIVVKFSFQEIGEPDPFCPNQKGREPEYLLPSLYSTPLVSQVNAVAVTDLSCPAPENSIASPIMAQEQFNSFMSSYESTMRRGPRYPYHPRSASQPSRWINPHVTCFNCGTRGHYADICTNPAISSYEQQQIRERLRREREQFTADYSLVEQKLEPPLSRSNTIAVTPRAILQRPTSEKPLAGVATTPVVTCVRSCKESERDLGQACKLASQIPKVRTIFQNPLAEKRTRIEEAEMDGMTGQQAAKAPRRSTDYDGTPSLRRSHRQNNNPLVYGRGDELEPVVEIEVADHSPQPEPEYTMDIADGQDAIESDSEGMDTPYPLSSRTNKGKKRQK